MEFAWILLGVLAFFTLLVLLISYICFRIAFFVSKKQRTPGNEYPIPDGHIYLPYRDTMVQWIREVRAMPHESFCITSFDGLKLFGNYYEYAPGAPIELMFHGYRGQAERDLCGGVQRCFALKRSALIVDQRACGRSEGNVITFGVNEHRDCLSWVEFMTEHFGPDVPIILTGISMGAATVVMAAGHPLPENVVGVLADCGFTSGKEIIKKVIGTMHLPPKLAYPFVKLGASLFGRFDLEEMPAIEAVKRCTLPLILLHGDDDNYVPYYMSQEIFDACPSTKKFVKIAGAGHGMSYLLAPEEYLKELGDFFRPILTDHIS